ncbi:MAG: MarR family transcriptional regulator [Hyphomonas sp.]
MSNTSRRLATTIDRLSAFFFLARRYGHALHAAEALSSGERAILKDVARGGGESVPELAASRAISRQAIQKTVNQLVARGAVAKAPSPEDRRANRLVATPEGRDLLRKLARRETVEASRYVDEFTEEELDVFDSVLTRMEGLIRTRVRQLELRQARP